METNLCLHIEKVESYIILTPYVPVCYFVAHPICCRRVLSSLLAYMVIHLKMHVQSTFVISKLKEPLKYFDISDFPN